MAEKYVTVQITPKGPPTSAGSPPSDDVHRCTACGTPVTPEELRANLWVCPHCDHHGRVSARERVEQLVDPGSFREVAAELRPADPLDFFDLRPYTDRLEEAQAESGLSEALVTGSCTMGGKGVALGVMDFGFLGGSMGSVVGERFKRLVERAVANADPLVVVSASGGARMQEGILALMQMAKTVVALEVLADAGLPFLSVLTNPTTGGVLASFATQADVIIAEPGARLFFTGPRVIEQTTREKLPADFGRAETHLAHGQLDLVVHRRELRDRLIAILALLEGGVRCSLEPVRSDTEVVSRGGRPLAQAVARAKELAVSSRGWLFGRDT